MTSKKLVLLGAPGSGKGTQAELIKENFAVTHLSVGDILRAEIKNKTQLGDKVTSFIDAGKLVPDALIIDIVKNKMEDLDGFLLDGFPRTLKQAEMLNSMLQEKGLSLDAVIYLNVSEDNLFSRLKARGRADDTEDVIQNRLKVYRDSTEPLIDYYKDQGSLKEVEGNGTIEDIFCQIKESLA